MGAGRGLAKQAVSEVEGVLCEPSSEVEPNATLSEETGETGPGETGTTATPGPDQVR